jgi:type VI secretion system secreted protein VgrG
MSEATRARFTFTAGPYGAGDLDVARVTGSERMSRPSSFDVDVVVRGAERAALGQLLGTRARLGFPGADGRQIAGIVARVSAHGMVDERDLYRIRVVPALWLLGRRRNSRIFQQQSAPAIVRAILSEHGVEQLWKVERAYPTREYCVQYRETDLQFVTRLLAEEGIFYFIADPPAGDGEAPETVVFADAASAHRPIAGDARLPVRRTGALLHGEHVASFSLEEQVRSASTVHRGFDFKRPRLDLRGEARAEGGAADAGAALEVYDHDGDSEEGRIDGAGARSALEQLRAGATMARGESNCRRLAPGGSFELGEHPSENLNRRYAVVRLDHEVRQVAGPRLEGGGEETYVNRFRCVPERVPYRPRRPRRELQQVTETATVVGPPGEEIHVDAHGRIKVQFHWDREGKNDEHSSCWLRAMQPWAGSAWGSQFIPRVGMEVVVTFVGGDVDRPMVVGAVYNAQNPTPYALPAHKTQSGIRTRSSPGGKGANELRFEDAAGEEQVYLHAQRDLDELVENDHTRTVRGDEAISVGRSSTVEIDGDQDVHVKGNEIITVEKNFVFHVVGKQVILFDGQGTGDGGDTSAAPPGPDDPAHAPQGGEGAAPPAETLSEADQLAGQVAAAKLLFLREQVPDDLYSRAGQMVDAAESAADRLAALQAAVQDPAALAEAALSEATQLSRAQALAERAREVRDAAGAAISDALLPAPAALHRLQVAVVDRLQGVWRAADGMAKGLFPQEAPEGSPIDGGSGRAGGGGGAKPKKKKKEEAKVSPWKNTGSTSMLTIKGGGIIDSPDGFTLTGQGGFVDIHNGVLLGSANVRVDLKAPQIDLDATGAVYIKGKSAVQVVSPKVHVYAGDEIHLQVGGSSIHITAGGIKITSGGAVQINGSFITLN